MLRLLPTDVLRRSADIKNELKKHSITLANGCSKRVTLNTMMVQKRLVIATHWSYVLTPYIKVATRPNKLAKSSRVKPDVAYDFEDQRNYGIVGDATDQTR